MTATYFLDKMPARLIESKVEYYSVIDNEMFLLNKIIGKEIEVEFTGRLQCLDCKKIVKKFYAQGLCYLCMKSSPLNSECIIRPELCEAHLGKGKVPEWEEKHHNQPHIVYLANSGGLKVGVTRTDQIPTRWIDQGADEAIILVQTPYRQLAGEIEVALKAYLSDKTNWRAMLKNVKNTSIDLLEEKYTYAETLNEISMDYGNYISEDDTNYEMNYPTSVLEKTVKSVKLDKQPQIAGVLTGIKGQYWILNNETVFNIRSHAGYEISLKY